MKAEVRMFPGWHMRQRLGDITAACSLPSCLALATSWDSGRCLWRE